MPKQKSNQSTNDIPIGTISKSPIAKRKLEDCDPGATRQEVLLFIEKVAKSPKPPRKHGEPPDSASS